MFRNKKQILNSLIREKTNREFLLLWLKPQDGGTSRVKDKMKIEYLVVFIDVYYICLSTLGNRKHKVLKSSQTFVLHLPKRCILMPLLYSFSCKHDHNDERVPLQWTTADCRTYWDFISACCSWLDREEQRLHNALTINHPERPVWYGHSQQECRGDGLMPAQQGWSYKQMPPQQGNDSKGSTYSINTRARS